MKDLKTNVSLPPLWGRRAATHVLEMMTFQHTLIANSSTTAQLNYPKFSPHLRDSTSIFSDDQ
jgi:hypothetical protein